MVVFRAGSIVVLVAAMVVAGAAQAAWPPSRCDHVRVLTANDSDEIVAYDGATLEDADDEQLDALGNALELMPEVLCKAVRRVAFIERPPEDDDDTVVDAWTNRNEHQDLVYLNTWSYLPWNRTVVNQSRGQRGRAIQRFIHESTHAAIRLLQSQQKAEPYRFRQERANPALWPADVRQLADEVVARNRLDTGVIREWQRIHEAFVAVGMAEPYLDDDWTSNEGANAAYLAGAGWMSAYGGEQAIEDIAEMTSWAIIRDAPDNPEDHACQVMNERSGASIRSADAAVFTKLGFVRTLGFIDESHYRDCVGALTIDAPDDGFHSFVGGEASRRYTENPRAGVGRGEGDDEQWLIANITADGTAETSAGEFAATIRLQLNVTPLVDAITDPGKRADRLAIPLEDVSYPRGVYLVGFRHGPINRLQITNRADDKLIMDVGQGIALVGLASTDGIVGSVAVQRIFNFSGGLLSSIAGDEPVAEPTRITFRYDPR
ncbi:hypothetical protein [Halomonas denitrificans]|nr:hypothetical protein [Halomonas denitrificans]